MVYSRCVIWSLVPKTEAHRTLYKRTGTDHITSWPKVRLNRWLRPRLLVFLPKCYRFHCGLPEHRNYLVRGLTVNDFAMKLIRYSKAKTQWHLERPYETEFDNPFANRIIKLRFLYSFSTFFTTVTQYEKVFRIVSSSFIDSKVSLKRMFRMRVTYMHFLCNCELHL